MPPEAVLTALRLVWTTLLPLNVPMALVGGLAMGAWKRPRFTKDVDLLVALGEHSAHQAAKQLFALGFRSKQPDGMVRLRDGTRFLQLVYDAPNALLNIRIDLLLATSDFHRQALDRRVVVPASELGFEVHVVSCEDLIILKLIAGRILDRVDVGELLKANRNTLDFDYLKSWVHQLHLERSFADAWTDAFQSESPPA